MTTSLTKKPARLGARSAAAIVLAILAALVVPATAANADAPAQSCWQNIDTDETQCFDASIDPLQEIADDTDTIVVAVPSDTPGARIASARPSALQPSSTEGVATTFIQVILYDNTGFGGSSFTYFTTNSGICSGSLVYPIANIESGWNDRVESYQSFNGCRTTLYANPSFGGTSFGPAVSATSLGSFNNTASSLLIDG